MVKVTELVLQSLAGFEQRPNSTAHALSTPPHPEQRKKDTERREQKINFLTVEKWVKLFRSVGSSLFLCKEVKTLLTENFHTERGYNDFLTIILLGSSSLWAGGAFPDFLCSYLPSK